MTVKTARTFGPNTLNNYTEEDIEWLRKLECSVCVCSKEISETGTPHLQFCITFKRSYSKAAVCKLHPKVHWEFQDCVQDMNYCRKREGELIIDVDNRKKRGCRTDIEEMKKIVVETNSMREVVQAATSVQSVRMAELWLKYHEPKRPISPAPAVNWRWGKTGVGKTRFVWENHGVDEVYTPTSYKWWEGYDGHKIVLIDEFRPNWCTFGQLIRLLDRYPYTVETKGGSRQIQATLWYITSSKPPKDIFDPLHFDADERVDQLTRRVTSVTEVLGDP